MNRQIPLCVPSLHGSEKNYVNSALNTNWVSSGGAFINEFEKNIAEYNNSKYGIACTNGTSALHVSLLASGIRKGDEVIVPTVTFIAPINAVNYIGAVPVFMDCDEYLNIDVLKINDFLKNECVFKDEMLRNKRTMNIIRAILPVHVFGIPVDMESLIEIANKYNLLIIEDATESLGSYFRKGKYKNKKTGTIGTCGCYSFNGNKIITTGGGGMVVTDDENAARYVRYLTTQAKDDELHYIHNEVGYNYRMTNLQAAIGLGQLEVLDTYIQIKRNNFNKYFELLDGYRGLSFVKESPYGYSNRWFYSLIVEKDQYGLSRNELMQKLNERSIFASSLSSKIANTEPKILSK